MTKVLDHGYVELLDIMGDDAEPARAARISYGNKDGREWSKDAKLIRYLYDHGHTSPFEMVELKWRVKCPIFVARQWLRYRTANVNEFSMRYADPAKMSDADEVDSIDFYVPEHFRTQAKDNKQGGVGPLGAQEEDVLRWYVAALSDSASTYHMLIRAGVCREQARAVLPLATYTEFIWKNDLHNTLHMITQRTADGAQWEIRQYAEAMRAILHERLPLLMRAIDA